MKKIAFLLWSLLSIYLSAQMRQFNNLYFLSKNIGWVSFSKDTNDTKEITSYKTTNGGLSWIKLAPEYVYDIIDFVDDSVGFMKVYSPNFNRIYKSTDKGETWNQMLDGVDVTVLDFITENIGYGVIRSNKFNLVRTSNGGANWDTMSILNYRRMGPVLSESKIISYSTGANYWISTDKGVSWIPKFISNTDSTQILVSFYDSLYGFACLNNNVYLTTNGGDNWELKSNINFTSGAWGVIAADSLDAICVSFDVSTFAITNDGFTSFEIKSSDTRASFYDYKGCEAIYASGDNYFLAKSTDCGNTWIPLTVNGLPSYTDVKDETIINSYSLSQNYPNPFNPSTNIKYTIPKQGLVTITIYDVLGKELMQLVNEEKNTGEYEIEFDGSRLSSGIYFYQIKAGEFFDTKKMLLMK